MTENEYLPARMVNEFVYCPRLFYLEHVQSEFRHSADTLEGQLVHRRVDREVGALPEPEGVEETLHARSLTLSSERLGAIAKMDLIEQANGLLIPVDYKRGKAPDHPDGAWEPERVQVCLQGLILRDNGYSCEEGALYFRASRRRVAVPFTSELIALTEQAVTEARFVAESPVIPAPLADSPKCLGCSLAPICLPDEVLVLASEQPQELERRLVPARDDALPVYVQAQGAVVGKKDERIQVKLKGEVVDESRLFETSQLAVFGNVQISTQLIKELCQREIPVCYFSSGGYFIGMTQGIGHKNVDLRIRQYEVAADRERCLEIASRLVWSKIKNSRTLLRRNSREDVTDTLEQLNIIAKNAARAESAESLLGYEGLAARAYFSSFKSMLRPDQWADFDFQNRNRRPPRDPVNALLSFVYALLVKEFTVCIAAVGFDPYLGFYHRPRYGKPALALDLAEEFRPLIGDSVVINLINNGEVGPGDFLIRGGAAALTPTGRKNVLAAFERRMDQLITHPIFGYTISYRRLLEVQTRLVARWINREIREYPVFRTR